MQIIVAKGHSVTPKVGSMDLRVLLSSTSNTLELENSIVKTLNTYKSKYLTDKEIRILLPRTFKNTQKEIVEKINAFIRVFDDVEIVWDNLPSFFDLDYDSLFLERLLRVGKR